MPMSRSKKTVFRSGKAIAPAFSQAREEGAFLIFDEADSLLSNRAFAARIWEVSQVNEMLTWMESHPLPFACTTNLADRLGSRDTAALQRESPDSGRTYATGPRFVFRSRSRCIRLPSAM